MTFASASPVTSTAGTTIVPSVTISVGSRFHAFDLARELHAAGMLHEIHTGYPRFAAARFGLPPERVRPVWTHEALNRAHDKLRKRSAGFISGSDATLSARFDRIVARRLRDGGNLFVGWSSQCLESLRAAARLGMLTVVERGSTHIEWQRAILAEERERTGIQLELPDERTVERELTEYEEADFIAVPSAFVASTFMQRGVSKHRLLLNPYGVDVERFHGERASRPPRSGLRVLHVGRVSARKGVHYLVPAVAEVPGAGLTLVGEIESGIEPFIGAPHVRALGSVAGAALPAQYANADVFCLLSLEEGLALVIVQAMAMGLPVVATPNTGAAELITDGVEGFIVPARDVEIAGERLQRLANDESLRAEMGARARARVMSGFSWRDYGQRARRIYEDALRARPPA